jgi:hypothetical protein
MRSQLSFAALMMVICAIGYPNQEGNGSSNLWEQMVTIPAQEQIPNHYVAHLLWTAGVRGGVEDKDNGCAISEQRYPEFHGSIQEALQAIRSPGGAYYTGVQRGQALFIRSVPQKESLLDTRINKFSFKPNENPVMIQGELFDLPEVRKRVKESKLYERGPELGFAVMPSKEPAEPVKIEDVSLREALERITLAHPHKLIWTYWEYTCDGKVYSQFHWLSR